MGSVCNSARTRPDTLTAEIAMQPDVTGKQNSYLVQVMDFFHLVTKIKHCVCVWEKGLH